MGRPNFQTQETAFLLEDMSCSETGIGRIRKCVDNSSIRLCVLFKEHGAMPGGILSGIMP
jgi:hypothetical protein